MDSPMINGIGYSWSSISVTIGGRKLVGIRAIEYAEEQDIEGTKGAGNKDIEVGYGDVKLTGSITLLAYEVDALEELSPTGRLQDLEPFPIIVGFNAGGKIKVHRLTFCILKKNGRTGKSGDKFLEVQIPLFIGDIKYK